MASNSRMPPPRHHHHPIPNPHPPGNFSPFEMIPPPEVIERKLSAQHDEIQKLVRENQRLADTHGSLRQDLAAAKHELHLIHTRTAEMMSEKEHQKRSLVDKMSAMEAELNGAEPIKVKLSEAHAEAKGLVGSRQDLISKVQRLTNDLHKAHGEAMQIPALLSEIDGLRQEHHHCRSNYDYEKKFYSDHLESLQAMEKKYAAMSMEVEKLRAELTNSLNSDPRTGVHYGVYNDSSMAVGKYPPAQNAYGEAQVVAQMGPTNEATGCSGQTSFVAGGYGYDPYGRLVVAAGYDSKTKQAMPPQVGYNGPPMGNVEAYDPQRAQLFYDMNTAAATHEAQAGACYYDPKNMAGYESFAKVSGGAQGQVVPTGNVVLPYGSSASGNRAGTTYEPLPRSGNQVGL